MKIRTAIDMPGGEVGQCVFLTRPLVPNNARWWASRVGVVNNRVTACPIPILLTREDCPVYDVIGEGVSSTLNHVDQHESLKDEVHRDVPVKV